MIKPRNNAAVMRRDQDKHRGSAHFMELVEETVHRLVARPRKSMSKTPGLQQKQEVRGVLAEDCEALLKLRHRCRKGRQVCEFVASDEARHDNDPEDRTRRAMDRNR